ncbi:MAG: pitrilysin family protein [Rectinemataceae bacterium]|jgi:predicted Zn-dependent peptidase
MIPTLRLPRGAALVAETAEAARSFAVGFWFPIGSRHEAPQERGFVHFVEHMTFKGTTKRSAAGISREIDRVGGYLNAFTDRDSICIHCQVPAARWRLALDVLADMAFNSVFRIEDFEREREVIVSEILSARDDPEERSHDEFLTSIWPSDPLSRKIAGESEDIRRITRDALYSFYEAEFSPRSLLVTASGPLPPADVAEALSSLLEGPPRGYAEQSVSPRRVSSRRPEATPLFRRASGYKRADMEQVHYYEAVQLDPPFCENDYYALAALNSALGEASSSRLFLSLREEKGLCYSVYSAFAMSRTECLWMASANVSEAQLAALSTEMDRQLDVAAENGIGDEECADAVSRLAGSFDLALDDTDFRMRRIARQTFFSGEAQDVEEARECMARLSGEDVNAICVRLLKGRERARFAYGSLSRRTAKASGLTEAKLFGISAAARRG